MLLLYSAPKEVCQKQGICVLKTGYIRLETKTIVQSAILKNGMLKTKNAIFCGMSGEEGIFAINAHRWESFKPFIYEYSLGLLHGKDVALKPILKRFS